MGEDPASVCVILTAQLHKILSPRSGTEAFEEVGEAGRVEVPAFLVAVLSRTDKTSASLARFYAFNTMPPKRKR